MKNLTWTLIFLRTPPSTDDPKEMQRCEPRTTGCKAQIIPVHQDLGQSSQLITSKAAKNCIVKFFQFVRLHRKIELITCSQWLLLKVILSLALSFSHTRTLSLTLSQQILVSNFYITMGCCATHSSLFSLSLSLSLCHYPLPPFLHLSISFLSISVCFLILWLFLSLSLSFS